MNMNREGWLEKALEHIAPRLAAQGGTLPSKLRVSCGFPKGSGGKGNKRIGEHWSPAASADGSHEIFISPTEADASRVLDILAHECVHACVPNAKHGAPFKRLAEGIGLEGKMTATVAGPAFKRFADEVIAAIGGYPHASLTPGTHAKTGKQTTRMVKCECGRCGYVARTTRKWIDEAGTPCCPVNGHGQMFEAA